MLETIGLGGDGDEVDAIEAVERRFGVVLDTADSANWVTAGDVFSSLLRGLPQDRRDADAAWRPFCEAICEESGADPRKVGPDTLLLAIGVREILVRWIRRVLGRSG
jgi:hypothetical protein